MALLTPLDADQRTTFLVVSMAAKTLRRLVGQLKTAPAGTRLDASSPWDLAWSLVDYYENDAEVAAAVDRALLKEVGRSPLADAVAGGGARAVTDLLLSSRDPARDLAWALLSAAGADAGPLAAELVQTIIAEYDDADARAKEEEEAAGGTPPPAPALDPAVAAARSAAKQAKQAQSQRDRALKRVEGTKERLAEVEQALATSRKALRAAEVAGERTAAERDRLLEEREALRRQLRAGTAGEVERLTAELEASTRRVRNLEARIEELQEAEATLEARLRTLEQGRTLAGRADDDAPAPGAAWSLPIFTDEFYDSLRRWDRRIVRNAFEKIYRLAEDWRHPSLRAIPLEGLADCYRLRVATDVRLIYRPLDGGRVEILSLIDREDLQRYIRNAKTR